MRHLPCGGCLSFVRLRSVILLVGGVSSPVVTKCHVNSKNLCKWELLKRRGCHPQATRLPCKGRKILRSKIGGVGKKIISIQLQPLSLLKSGQDTFQNPAPSCKNSSNLWSREHNGEGAENTTGMAARTLHKNSS